MVATDTVDNVYKCLKDDNILCIVPHAAGLGRTGKWCKPSNVSNISYTHEHIPGSAKMTADETH